MVLWLKDPHRAAPASPSSASATWACRWRPPSPTRGFTVDGLDMDQRKVDARHAGRHLHRRHRRRALRPAGRGGAPPRLTDCGDPGRCRRRDHLRPHPLHRAKQPDLTCIVAGGADDRCQHLHPGCSSSWRAPPTRHHQEVLLPLLEASGPGLRPGLRARLLARSGSIPATSASAAEHPQDRQRRRPGERASWPPRSTATWSTDGGAGLRRRGWRRWRS